jgi:hypothetical protein
MKYPDSHWEEVAKCYKRQTVRPSELVGGKTVETITIAKVQDHYPDTSIGRIRAWIKLCREKGLL